jgi:hypothetical protein
METDGDDTGNLLFAIVYGRRTFVKRCREVKARFSAFLAPESRGEIPLELSVRE